MRGSSGKLCTPWASNSIFARKKELISGPYPLSPSETFSVINQYVIFIFSNPSGEGSAYWVKLVRHRSQWQSVDAITRYSQSTRKTFASAKNNANCVVYFTFSFELFGWGGNLNEHGDTIFVFLSTRHIPTDNNTIRNKNKRLKIGHFLSFLP